MQDENADLVSLGMGMSANWVCPPTVLTTRAFCVLTDIAVAGLGERVERNWLEAGTRAESGAAAATVDEERERSNQRRDHREMWKRRWSAKQS